MATSGRRDDDRTSLAGASILVAEDDPDNQKIVAMILAGKGATALPVADAAQLDAVLADIADGKASVPQAVVLDWNLAGSTGDELLRRIEQRCPALSDRVLVVTGDILRDEERSTPAGRGGRSRHGLPVLLKPFSPADLTKALSDLLAPRGQG